MKVNLDTISKRAKEILANPQFLNTSITEDFKVNLDSSDKILTASHPGKKGEIVVILSEVLIIFAKNHSALDLWKINLREVENFLRDENHLPALNFEMKELEESLGLLKVLLIAAIIRAKSNESIKKLSRALFDWEKLSLVTKNIWAHDLLELLGLELIYCDGLTLTVTKAPKEAKNSDIELLMKSLLVNAENNLPLKVVAVQ